MCFTKNEVIEDNACKEIKNLLTAENLFSTQCLVLDFNATAIKIIIC